MKELIMNKENRELVVQMRIDLNVIGQSNNTSPSDASKMFEASAMLKNFAERIEELEKIEDAQHLALIGAVGGLAGVVLSLGSCKTADTLDKLRQQVQSETVAAAKGK